MKSVIVFLSLVVFVLAHSVQERWNTVHKDCQSDPDLFVPEIIFEQLKKGENPTLPHNFGAHAFCMLSSLDLQEEDGDISQDGVREAVERSSASNKDEVVHECSSIDKDSDEKNALALFACLGKNKIDIGQF